MRERRGRATSRSEHVLVDTSVGWRRDRCGQDQRFATAQRGLFVIQPVDARQHTQLHAIGCRVCAQRDHDHDAIEDLARADHGVVAALGCQGTGLVCVTVAHDLSNLLLGTWFRRRSQKLEYKIT